jgi:hypothetical protein
MADTRQLFKGAQEAQVEVSLAFSPLLIEMANKNGPFFSQP